MRHCADMEKNLKIFLIVFILSLPFWWGTNLLEKELKDFFFWRELSQNPQILTAQIAAEQKLEDLKPIKKPGAEDLEIEAESAITLFIPARKDALDRVLFEKNSDKKLAIASLTKLMTAKIVLENYDLSKEITISRKAVEQEEDFGKLKTGKTFSVEYLLYPLLMESSNDAAFSLANDYNGMTGNEFVRLMNLEVKDMGLKNTYFANVTGLDPEPPKTAMNYSTVADLAKITKELLKYPLIWEILSTSNFNLYGPELTNTNRLLEEIPSIVGGKTGYTEKAGGCMLLVLKSPRNSGYLINIILGSNDRFGEIKKLVDWLKLAYKW